MKFRKQFLFVLLSVITAFTGYAQQNIDLLILNKKYSEALLEIDKNIEQQPSVALYFKKGIVFTSVQKYQEALYAYSQALQIEPDNKAVLSEMAEGLSLLGNYRDAVVFYEKAIANDTTDLALRGRLGRVYINLKEYKNAYDTFSGIYAKDSSNVYWNKQFAYCSYKFGRFKQSAYLYEKVLEANPRDHGTYINLVHSYNSKKQGGKIMATIDKGLEQFPNDKDLLFEKANFFFKTKRYGPAMIYFEKFFAAGGNPVFDIKMNYGISAYFAEDTEKAHEIFDELFSAVPNDPFVMYYKSLCYKREKNFEEAEKIMQWAIEASTPEYVAEMYHHLGQIMGQQRKFKESIASLEKAYELAPKKFEILFEIATTYEEYNSNKTLALNYYRIYLKEAGAQGSNINYALDRITKIKEDMFFEE